jgi:RHS repeat-associated protein
MGHFPFGESWYNATGDKLLFTTYERDAESGNDYAQARYYINRLALFSALDPLSGSTIDPQTLNRYDYVRNNPISSLDPTGQNRVKTYGDCDPDQQNCSGGAGFGWGASPSCSVDGLGAACSSVYALLNMGAAVQCPNNVCLGINGNGQFIHFWAFAGLAEAVDGYYAVSGVGSLSYNVDQAGIAAAQWGIWYESQTGSEVGGSLWCAYGVCSSTLQQLGQPGASSVLLDFGFSDIPNGTDPAGWWRAETGESPHVI